MQLFPEPRKMAIKICMALKRNRDMGRSAHGILMHRVNLQIRKRAGHHIVIIPPKISLLPLLSAAVGREPTP